MTGTPRTGGLRHRFLPWVTLGVLVSWAAAVAESPARSHTDIGGDLTLTDHEGRDFSLQDLRGKLVLLSFGYTYCPDVCPLILSVSARVADALAERGLDIVPVFVSLDPKRDTPDVLASYVRHFHPRMIGLTGSPERLARVAERYSARFEVNDDGRGDGYTLDHTSNLYVLDTRGQVAAIVPYGLPAEHVAERIERLLRPAP